MVNSERETEAEQEPEQETETGLRIPIPKRGEVLRALRKVAGRVEVTYTVKG